VLPDFCLHDLSAIVDGKHHVVDTRGLERLDLMSGEERHGRFGV
jgi:hypothetical protein